MSSIDRADAIVVALYAAGGRQEPKVEELAVAPILEFWMVMIADDGLPPLIAGDMHGYPSVPNGSMHLGDELIALDPGGRWALTLSRLYRLGAPAGDLLEGGGDGD